MHVRKNLEQQKVCHDRCSHHRHFTIGQNLWIHNFRQGPRWLEGVIVDSLGPSSFLIRTRSGEMWRRHLHHVRDGRTQRHNERGEEREVEGEMEIADPCDDVDSPVPGTYQPVDYFPTSSGSSEPPAQPNLSSHSSVPTDHRYPSRTCKPLERLYANIEQ